MEVALLVLLLVAIAIGIVAMVSLARSVVALRAQIDSLEGQVLRISVQVQEQEKRWEEMKGEETEEGPNSLASLVRGDGKSPVSTLALIGFRLLAAYLRRRAAQAAQNDD